MKAEDVQLDEETLKVAGTRLGGMEVGLKEVWGALQAKSMSFHWTWQDSCFKCLAKELLSASPSQTNGILSEQDVSTHPCSERDTQAYVLNAGAPMVQLEYTRLDPFMYAKAHPHEVSPLHDEGSFAVQGVPAKLTVGLR